MTGTFSESWHRVANQRLSLHPAVRVRRQTYRGERYYVLENPFANQFFRLRPAAWEFVARLHRDRTVDEVWRECLERFPDEAPGQEAVVQLLGQLYQANLLQYDHAADTTALAARQQQRVQRELKARLWNIMFFRIPLLDPDRFLLHALPLVGRIFSPVGGLVWLVVIAFGLKTVAENWTSVRDQYEGVLAPGNLPLLYLGLVILKTLHEFGHAFMCRKFGGEVHTMGVMFMIFTPVPYVDVTSSWSFRFRGQRVLVGLAGMIVELFIAALAVMVWSRTSPGTIHSLAYNMMFVASVSTLVFNLNPLLRFDGYYILGDLLGIANLGQRANQHLRHLAERGLFGVRKSESPARTHAEAGWLTVYGITSGIYRVVVFTGVLLAVADRYLLLGLIMLFTCATAWVIVPTGLFINYLVTSPRLDRVRWRACAVSAVLALGLVLPLAVVPLPSHFRAPGIVEAVERAQVINDAPGIVTALLAEPGSHVSVGQPLLQLTNRELDLEVVSTRASLAEMEARLRQALSDATPNLKPLLARQLALSNRLDSLLADRAALTVKARVDGVWAAPEARDNLGRSLSRGTLIGQVVSPGAREFTATVLQRDADRLFRVRGVEARRNGGDASPTELHAEVRLRGEAGEVLVARSLRIVPGESRSLPSAALGWQGGGEIPTSRQDPQGRRAAEPFFEVRAELPRETAATLAHGRSGRIRFDLPPEPLVSQGCRRLMQLLQRRYQL